MSGRSNAASELARIWLQERHGCLVDEGFPVPVPYALSDIDIVAMRPDLTPLELPNGVAVGPRLIVETKAEHDWDRSGREFGLALKSDASKIDPARGFIPRDTRGIKFTMLREQHYEQATGLFGVADFDRLFVVHAIDPQVIADLEPLLSQHRIHWLTIPELIEDLDPWYRAHPRPAALRRSLTGDLIHLLLGIGNYRLQANSRSD